MMLLGRLWLLLFAQVACNLRRVTRHRNRNVVTAEALGKARSGWLENVKKSHDRAPISTFTSSFYDTSR